MKTPCYLVNDTVCVQQDVMELIPEFYCLSDFLKNSNRFELGVTQAGDTVSLRCINSHSWCDICYMYRDLLSCTWCGRWVMYYCLLGAKAILWSSFDFIERCGIDFKCRGKIYDFISCLLFTSGTGEPLRQWKPAQLDWPYFRCETIVTFKDYIKR